ncbi:MAG: formyltetrahydrofolate deformylase [Flavobacteriaceae bacterium]|nr:formyltetrahydrofolate deformylase [Flavobacteriaceae bacterium]MBL6685156.1 formyltetrahydrofolate deformylase [Flavobacteriaceae bacterium]
MSILTLTIQCPDKKGIIADVTKFIYSNKGNILYIDQYVDRENKAFFMRLESEFASKANGFNTIHSSFEKGPAKKYNMNWSLFQKEQKRRMALFVSKYDHCLYDLLGRYRSGELDVEIPFIYSNHPDLEHIADSFRIQFYHFPVSKSNKIEAEEFQLNLLKKYNISFIVLARYMQIISPKIINEFTNKIINIHHSFLPAFPGAKPYHSAFERGVKIIGATSHYITDELDGGPIIEQDVTHVSHTNSINQLVIKGRDLEKIVLARAVKNHISHKVMVFRNKTIIFS